MAQRNNADQTDPSYFDPVDSKNMLLQNVKRPHSITTPVATAEKRSFKLL
jgi:hypothetical protein